MHSHPLKSQHLTASPLLSVPPSGGGGGGDRKDQIEK